jgi:hypothetical protein
MANLLGLHGAKTGSDQGNGNAEDRERIMMTKRLLWVPGLALCCLGLSTAYHTSAGPNLGQAWGATFDESGYTHDYSDATLAKVIPGETTKEEVEKLLGKPWRTTNFAEPGEDEPGPPSAQPPLVWEWRGEDKQIGPYRIHVEIKEGVVSNIAKIPEKTGIAPARVAPWEASAPRDLQTPAPGVALPSTQVSPPTGQPTTLKGGD